MSDLRNLTLLDFYEGYYRPARHPGDPFSPNCRESRSCLRNLCRVNAYQQWRTADGQRLLVDDDTLLHKRFERWLRQQGQAPWQLRVADLSDVGVVEMMAWLVAMGRARATANKNRRTVNAIWRYAVEVEILETLPKNKPYRVEQKEPWCWSSDQLKLILQVAADMPGKVGPVEASTWWPAFAGFLYSTGVRINAALKVPTENLNLATGFVKIPAAVQKQKKDQLVDLFPSTIAALDKLRLAQRGVPTLLGDWTMRTETLTDHWKRLLVAAGFYPDVPSVPKEACFHSMRRTVATRLYEKGGIELAQQRLGHSDAKVTWRYIDAHSKKMPRVSELLPDPLPPDTPPEDSAAAAEPDVLQFRRPAAG